MLINRLSSTARSGRTSQLYSDLAELFRALGDASRVKIVDSLVEGEMCVSDIAEAVGVSESAVSQHLRHLRELRLVRGRREGKMIYYAIADDHVRVLLRVGVEHLEEER